MPERDGGGFNGAHLKASGAPESEEAQVESRDTRERENAASIVVILFFFFFLVLTVSFHPSLKRSCGILSLIWVGREGGILIPLALVSCGSLNLLLVVVDFDSIAFRFISATVKRRRCYFAGVFC